jgi:hypothetical protein
MNDSKYESGFGSSFGRSWKSGSFLSIISSGLKRGGDGGGTYGVRNGFWIDGDGMIGTSMDSTVTSYLGDSGRRYNSTYGFLIPQSSLSKSTNYLCSLIGSLTKGTILSGSLLPWNSSGGSGATYGIYGIHSGVPSSTSLLCEVASGRGSGWTGSKRSGSRIP